MSHPFRVAVLISGSGSNLQALIDQQSALGYQVVMVLSNVASAYGLTRAQQAGIDTIILNHKDYESREAFESAMIGKIDAYQVDAVILAGFMRILTPVFIGHYEGRLLNIHPSLLPKYKGLHTHARAIEAGDEAHGASVHLVTAELDGGPILAQGSVPVLPDDTHDILAKRVLTIEHQLYPAVVSAMAKGLIDQTSDPITIAGDFTPLSLDALLSKVQKA